MAEQVLSKAMLISHVADQSGADRKTVMAVLDALGDVVCAQIVSGIDVALPGICKVVVRDRAARTMRNPATGAPIEKAADRAVKITPLKTLRDAANG